MIQRLGVQTPLGAIFDEISFVLCNFRSVRHTDRNASDFFIVKNPNDSLTEIKRHMRIFFMSF